MMLAAIAVAAPYTYVAERNVVTTMRDGTVLRANVFIPDAPGRFPVVVSRTPYGKNDFDEFGRLAAMHGFVAVIQDVRGRYDSGGRFYPFVNEMSDGYDTVEWAAQQSYADGSVFMYGGSYLGITQWLAALAQPPHLVAIAPMIAPSSIRKDAIYRGGALEQLFDQSWTSLLADNSYPNPAEKNYQASLQPPEAFLAGARRDATYYTDWLTHGTDDAFWQPWGDLAGQYGRIKVPAFIVGGWYDIFQEGSIASYEGMRASAGTERARRLTRLTMAPGGHPGWLRRVGAVDFGPLADVVSSDPAADINEAIFAWFREVRAGDSHRAPVRYFTMGENDWRESDVWPPATARDVTYYLHAGALATTTRPTLDDPADRYVYDPANPVPTVGGAICCGIHNMPRGPQDQAAVERRGDVLSYTTPSLDRPILVAGPVRATIYASSDASDTDFTAKLVDVWPSGFAQNLCDGIVRARYRRSMSAPQPLVPGAIERYDVDLGQTAIYLAPGHRLRIEVSSSNFPRFDRNPNLAHNAVYHDAAHPSGLHVFMLPDIPG